MKPTKQQIQNFVAEWRELENEMGEDILDGNFEVGPVGFMSWCYGRGYLTSFEYDAWFAAYLADELYAIDENHFIYDSDSETTYAVVRDEEWSDEGYEKAIAILGEFVLSVDYYSKQWNEFSQKIKNREPY